MTPAEERAFWASYKIQPEFLDSEIESVKNWLTSANAGNYISEFGKVKLLAVIAALEKRCE